MVKMLRKKSKSNSAGSLTLIYMSYPHVRYSVGRIVRRGKRLHALLPVVIMALTNDTQIADEGCSEYIYSYYPRFQ